MEATASANSGAVRVLITAVSRNGSRSRPASAEENGQSKRFLLEKAIERYISQRCSLTAYAKEVMEAFRRSNEKFRNLYHKLAE